MGSETQSLRQIAQRLLLDELASFCGNMQTFSNQIDECKVMNASLTTYWLDACAEIYKEILFDRSYNSDVRIVTKSAPIPAQMVEEKNDEKEQVNDDEPDEKEAEA